MHNYVYYTYVVTRYIPELGNASLWGDSLKPSVLSTPGEFFEDI